MIFRKSIIALATILFSCAVFSQDKPTLKFGTGGPTGNYFSMANDIASYCSDFLNANIEVQNSGGSVVNLDGLTKKKYSLGMVQEDVLQYMAKRNPSAINKNRVKVVHGLHVETAHLLVPKDYKPKGNSVFSGLLSKLNGEGSQPLSLTSLKGQAIGSWGGSMVSAKALSYFLGLNMNIVEIPEGQRSAPNLPVLLVGGQPYKPIENLLATGRYTLIGIDYRTLSKEAPFYVEVDATYGKLSVPSFGVQALLLGKAFRSEKRNIPMTQLATCISKNLFDLADDPNTNPNWQSVNPDDDQKDWSYFPIK